MFAPSGLPTPYCKVPAHLATDSLFAAITDLSANLRRKDIMRSGLWPPVGLASGVTCPALRYCSTECGTEAAAMLATICTNKLLFPASEPKSYQCSAPQGTRGPQRPWDAAAQRACCYPCATVLRCGVTTGERGKGRKRDRETERDTDLKQNVQGSMR